MIFPIKAVIFDADGVLLDSLSVWKELGKRYITDLGYQPVAEMDEILFPMSMEQGAAWLKNRFTLAYSEEKIVMDLKSRIRKYYFEEVPAKSGARELLQCLAEQKIPAAVATSSPREHICRALERNGLLSFFDKSIPPVRSEKANILRGSILQLQKHWERSHPGRWLWRIHSTRCRLPEMQDF